jgi:hypothetical protein
MGVDMTRLMKAAAITAAVVGTVSLAPTTPAVASSSGTWHYVANYASYHECADAGRQGERLGRWQYFNCSPSPYRNWRRVDLWAFF